MPWESQCFWALIYLLLSGVTAIRSQPELSSLDTTHGSHMSSRQVGEETSSNATYDSSSFLKGNFQFYCNERYRTDLSPTSCALALDQIPKADRPLLFAMRGGGHYDVPLPTRFIGSDGKCFFEVVLKDHVLSEKATYQDLYRAARGLFYGCALRSKIGGLATDIGASKGLGLIMTSYVPRVTCHKATPPPTQSCKRIVDVMKVSSVEQYFATGDDRHAPRPDVKLPRYMYETDHKCMGIIQTTGPEELSSWYEIWEAVQAIYGMCVKIGQWGRAWGRGRKGSLYVELLPETLQSNLTRASNGEETGSEEAYLAKDY